MRPIPFFLPVVHVDHRNTDISILDFETLYSLGVKGCFLICHTTSTSEAEHRALNAAMALAREHLVDVWVGVNFLQTPDSRPNSTLVHYAELMGADGLWRDWSPETENTFTGNGRIPIFAGAAFKYVNPEADPAVEVARLRGAAYATTTSGDATGAPPTLDKVRRFRQAIDSHAQSLRLACASGLSVDNIGELAPFLDHALVSSSLLGYGSQFFSRDKVEAFIAAVPPEIYRRSVTFHGQ